jgi:hypothetical protein
MNKLLFFVATLMIITAQAQTKKGNMMAGGSINYYSQNQPNAVNDYSSISLSPNFGYFIADNLAVGASVLIGSTTSHSINTKTVTNSFGIGPFARYYKYTSNENFAIFGQATLSFNNSKTHVTPGGDGKNNSIIFSIAPGFAYFFNQHWAMELYINGLVYQSSNSGGNNRTNSFQFGISSLSPSIGLKYHFGK